MKILLLTVGLCEWGWPTSGVPRRWNVLSSPHSLRHFTQTAPRSLRSMARLFTRTHFQTRKIDTGEANIMYGQACAQTRIETLWPPFRFTNQLLIRLPPVIPEFRPPQTDRALSCG